MQLQLFFVPLALSLLATVQSLPVPSSNDIGISSLVRPDIRPARVIGSDPSLMEAKKRGSGIGGAGAGADPNRLNRRKVKIPPKPDPTKKPDTSKPEPTKTPEPTKSEPPKPEPTKSEPPKPEPSKSESIKPEPSKSEPSKKPEPSKSESTKPEPSKSEPTKPQSSGQPEPSKQCEVKDKSGKTRRADNCNDEGTIQVEGKDYKLGKEIATGKEGVVYDFPNFKGQDAVAKEFFIDGKAEVDNLRKVGQLLADAPQTTGKKKHYAIIKKVKGEKLKTWSAYTSVANSGDCTTFMKKVREAIAKDVVDQAAKGVLHDDYTTHGNVLFTGTKDSVVATLIDWGQTKDASGKSPDAIKKEVLEKLADQSLPGNFFTDKECKASTPPPPSNPSDPNDPTFNPWA